MNKFLTDIDSKIYVMETSRSPDNVSLTMARRAREFYTNALKHEQPLLDVFQKGIILDIKRIGALVEQGPQNYSERRRFSDLSVRFHQDYIVDVEPAETLAFMYAHLDIIFERQVGKASGDAFRSRDFAADVLNDSGLRRGYLAMLFVGMCNFTGPVSVLMDVATSRLSGILDPENIVKEEKLTPEQQWTVDCNREIDLLIEGLDVVQSIDVLTAHLNLMSTIVATHAKNPRANPVKWLTYLRVSAQRIESLRIDPNDVV